MAAAGGRRRPRIAAPRGARTGAGAGAAARALGDGPAAAAAAAAAGEGRAAPSGVGPAPGTSGVTQPRPGPPASPAVLGGDQR